MRKNLIILITLLIFHCNQLHSQDTAYISVNQPTFESVFESYDFNSGSYTLYATHWSDRADSLTKALGIFYIQDTVALNTIKNEWQFWTSFDFLACGYDFIFYVCKKNEVIEVLRLNLYCNSLTSSNGNAFKFDANKLPLLKQNADTLEKYIFNYSTRQEAIKAMDSLQLDSTNFIPKKDDLNWYTSEGNFMFDYAFDPKFTPDVEPLITKLEAEIKRTYPNETFKIELCGASPKGNYSFRIYSSEALFLKFDLYETVLNFDKYNYFQIEVYKKITLKKN